MLDDLTPANYPIAQSWPNLVAVTFSTSFSTSGSAAMSRRCRSRSSGTPEAAPNRTRNRPLTHCPTLAMKHMGPPDARFGEFHSIPDNRLFLCLLPCACAHGQAVATMLIVVLALETRTVYHQPAACFTSPRLNLLDRHIVLFVVVPLAAISCLCYFVVHHSSPNDSNII